MPTDARTGKNSIILFGVRSPIVVEIEESCRRNEIDIVAAISVGGHPRLFDRSKIRTLSQWAAEPLPGRFIAAAFTPSRRRELAEMGQSHGLVLAAALVDPHAVLARTVRTGVGTYINAGAIIGAMSSIGDGVLINRAASVGHHVVLEDWVSIGPGATLAGNIHVGAGAMIGAGAVILPDLRIGAGAIIGAGSLVREHVENGAFVVGNPAKVRPFDPDRSSLHVEDGE